MAHLKVDDEMKDVVEKQFVQSVKVDIDVVVPGMVLAEDVKNSAGGVVLAKDSYLSKGNISKLREISVFSVFIEKYSPPKEFDALRGKSVIVVENSPYYRHMFSKMLYRLGMCVCEEVETAEEGVRFAHRYKPELIMMSMDLPGINGIKTIGKIHKWLPGTKFIAVTADGNKKTIVQALQAGASDFLIKPVKWDVLRDRLLKLFDVEKHVEKIGVKTKTVNLIDGPLRNLCSLVENSQPESGTDK